MSSRALAAAAACVSLGLTACSPTLRAGWQTVEQAWGTPAPVRNTDLNPALRYLLVQQQGREALLVWVGDEPGPLGSTSVWVGADGVVLRTAQGRLVGVAEPTRNWRLVRQAATGSSTVTDIVDVQPGHRIGLRQTGQRTALSAAPTAHRFVGDTRGLRWQEDRWADASLPPSHVALDAQNQVVYGQRCLAADWCLSWQGWPANPKVSP